MTAEDITRAPHAAAVKTGKPAAFEKGNLQKVLIDALAGALKVRPADVDPAKSFDDYGLDSIDAVIATEWIGTRLGIVLPPEFLFVFRSIDAVTDALLAGDYRQSSAPRRPAAQGPVFLFPGGGGADEPALIRFREQAAGRVTFEVVHVDKWQSWVDQRLTFSDLAARAAQSIDETWPHGAVRLAGYSQGGQLAYAAAFALKERGRTVELVCLLDTGAQARYRTSAAKPGLLSSLPGLCSDYVAAKIRGQSLFPPGRKWIHFTDWVWDRRGGPELVMMVVRFGRRILPGRARIRGDNFIQMRVFARLWGDWTEKHQGQMLLGTPVVLFRSEDPGPADLGWGTLCAKVTIIPVKGDHSSMLTSEGLIGEFIAAVAEVEAR